MARRLPSQPPVLPGFSYVHVLGSGGFADVFLYEQNMPRRQVAVKVMLSEVVNDQVRQMFQAEANLMAQLSANPSILTVYQASVSSDGRPYLVMELCSSALSERYRREPIPVHEVLRIAVKIGSAVETAHRAGVLHRDIKPSNILTTAYGHPVLSDFGIASTLTGQSEQESVGLSIPWSAPEVLIDEAPGSIASEVWSLAATMYSLLAGRSPFEIPGGANSSSDLMARIARAKPQPITRPDVPANLEEVLRRAMSRRPEHRPASALEFVRELQLIEAELGFSPTALEIATDEWAHGTVADGGDRTVLRPVSASLPLITPGRRRRRTPAIASAPPVGTVRSDRSGRSALFSRRWAASGRGGSPALLWGVAASVVVLAGLGVVLSVALLRAQGDEEIPRVSDIQAQQESESGVVFSWDDPGMTEVDRYQIVVTEDGVASPPSLQESARFVVDADPGQRVCVTVAVNRNGTPGVASAEKCVDMAED